MPIFEFECTKCARKFEYLVRSSGDKPECPKCANTKLKKLISGFAFTSKDGSGATTASSAGCSGCSGGDCSSCRH
ncbi:MAG: zinc ribbon domain-containing protein [Candidatus Omnitrophica bacterium]|nr:zinc ribbon domain-containing protein [Candidatus Omnitrophota bacterium]